MKFKKLILILTDDTDQLIIKEAVQLSKKFKSKLFALYIIDTQKIARLARLTHQKIDVLNRKSEEEGWQLLYLVEDEAVGNGVWTSLHFEDGNLINTLKKYIETYNIDVMLTKRKDETKKLFVCSPVPVIGL